MFLFVFLLLFTDVANAAQRHSHDRAEWDACADAAYGSDEAREAEYIGGKIVVEDFLVGRCGYRPVVARPEGRLELYDSDCAEMFKWSSRGDCVAEDTVAIELSVRELDPRVFDRTKYKQRCERYQSTGRTDDYRSFRDEVCSARLSKRSPTR